MTDELNERLAKAICAWYAEPEDTWEEYNGMAEYLLTAIERTYVVWDRERLRRFLSYSHCDFDCIAGTMECLDPELCA
jgi:hypothetical protein